MDVASRSLPLSRFSLALTLVLSLSHSVARSPPPSVPFSLSAHSRFSRPRAALPSVFFSLSHIVSASPSRSRSLRVVFSLSPSFSFNFSLTHSLPFSRSLRLPLVLSSLCSRCVVSLSLCGLSLTRCRLSLTRDDCLSLSRSFSTSLVLLSRSFLLSLIDRLSQSSTVSLTRLSLSSRALPLILHITRSPSHALSLSLPPLTRCVSHSLSLCLYCHPTHSSSLSVVPPSFSHSPPLPRSLSHWLVYFLSLVLSPTRCLSLTRCVSSLSPAPASCLHSYIDVSLTLSLFAHLLHLSITISLSLSLTPGPVSHSLSLSLSLLVSVSDSLICLCYAQLVVSLSHSWTGLLFHSFCLSLVTSLSLTLSLVV